MENSSVAHIPQQPARAQFLSPAAALCTIFAAWFLIYVPSLSRPGLLDDADSLHAEASREMLLNHNWVTLYVNGIRYLEKAPFMYWAVALSYKLFGVGESQTRLPLALAVLALAAAAFIFGRHYLGIAAGFYSALILVTAPGIYVYTRFLIPDVIVALWLTLGLYLFLIAYEQAQPSRWLCYAFAATIALNVLTKSLIGIVFPVMIIFVFLALAGNFKKTPRSCTRCRPLWRFSLSPPPGTSLPLSAAPRNQAAPKKDSCGFISSTSSSCATSINASPAITIKSRCCFSGRCSSSGSFPGSSFCSQP